MEKVTTRCHHFTPSLVLCKQKLSMPPGANVINRCYSCGAALDWNKAL